MAELLTVIGPAAERYVALLTRSRVFEIGNFDAKCAVELAILNRETFLNEDTKNAAEPYQKIKVDRQILAICRVYGASELYTDDSKLARRARLCGLRPVGIGEIEIPENARQGKLDLDSKDDIPDSENDSEG